MASFELRPQGPYSLRSSIRFLEGFAPAAYEGGSEDELRLAFVAGGGEEAAGVSVRSEREKVLCEVSGEADPASVKEQVRRILSLDVDGRGFPEVGERDPVVGGLQKRYPGLRPVCFNSPYEAAAWAVIAQRTRIVQAAKLKSRLASELGELVQMRGRTEEYAFPALSRLAALESFPGLGATKVERLRAIGYAAAEGKLDASRLRSMPSEEALANLAQLPGIGDFSAGLILLRGAGAPDELPAHEPRLRRAVALAYGLEEPPTLQWLRRTSEAWRPYRSWVCVLLRTMLEDETREIGGGRAP